DARDVDDELRARVGELRGHDAVDRLGVAARAAAVDAARCAHPIEARALRVGVARRDAVTAAPRARAGAAHAGVRAVAVRPAPLALAAADGAGVGGDAAGAAGAVRRDRARIEIVRAAVAER